MQNKLTPQVMIHALTIAEENDEKELLPYPYNRYLVIAYRQINILKLSCSANSILMQNNSNFCPKAMLHQAMDSTYCITYCITALHTLLTRFFLISVSIQRIDIDLGI